jgi:hypothetical protein
MLIFSGHTSAWRKLKLERVTVCDSTNTIVTPSHYVMLTKHLLSYQDTEPCYQNTELQQIGK